MILVQPGSLIQVSAIASPVTAAPSFSAGAGGQYVGGNVFDHMAWALVSSQLDSIDQLRYADAYTDVPEPGKGLDTLDQSRVKQLDAAIPDWLRNAPAKDMDDYRRYITALGKLYRKAKYRVARTEKSFFMLMVKVGNGNLDILFQKLCFHHI